MAVTPNYSWPVPVATDYVKDGWEAISDLGNAIDTTVAGLPVSPEVILSSGTFTAQTAVNLSNLLSNTYKFYNLKIYSTPSTSASLTFKFRENTTDYSLNYVHGSFSIGTNGVSGNYTSGTNSTGQLLATSTLLTFADIDIARVSASQGSYIFQSYGGDNQAIYGSGRNSGISNFNGVSVSTSTGTITGYYVLTGRN